MDGYILANCATAFYFLTTYCPSITLHSPTLSSLLFLQVDNRPCSQFPPTCFPFAAQAANFLRAMKASNRLSHARQVLEVRGVSEELGYREEDRGNEDGEVVSPFPDNALMCVHNLFLSLCPATMT